MIANTLLLNETEIFEIINSESNMYPTIDNFDLYINDHGEVFKRFIFRPFGQTSYYAIDVCQHPSNGILIDEKLAFRVKPKEIKKTIWEKV